MKYLPICSNAISDQSERYVFNRSYSNAVFGEAEYFWLWKYAHELLSAIIFPDLIPHNSNCKWYDAGITLIHPSVILDAGGDYKDIDIKCLKIWRKYAENVHNQIFDTLLNFAIDCE